MATILAFLNALPILWNIYKKASSSFGEDWGSKTQDLIDAYGKVNDAKTPEDLMDAAKRVHNAWTK
jgi:hypothetical protein